MITFFHVIISLLSGLGNTAAGCLWHPGGRIGRRRLKKKGGTRFPEASDSQGFHADVFSRFKAGVQFGGQIEDPVLMVKFLLRWQEVVEACQCPVMIE